MINIDVMYFKLSHLLCQAIEIQGIFFTRILGWLGMFLEHRVSEGQFDNSLVCRFSRVFPSPIEDHVWMHKRKRKSGLAALYFRQKISSFVTYEDFISFPNVS